MKHTLSEIAKALGCSRELPGYEVYNILTDSRSLTCPGRTLFFALHSPQRDGHDYIPSLAEKGVSWLVIDHHTEATRRLQQKGLVFIKVADTLEALQKLGSYFRGKFDKPLIAVTGSRGKTVVKEWLKQLLPDTWESITASPRSYNSQIGVPLSLCDIDTDAAYGVFEAGISQPGEMVKLREILRPDIAVITNVGAEHSQNFESRGQKAKEKALLASGSKYVIFNQDDIDIRNAVETLAQKPENLIGYSFINPKSPLLVSTKKKGGKTFINYRYNGGEEKTFVIPFTSPWHVENAITSLAVMLVLGKNHDDIAERMLELEPVRTRLDVLDGVNECVLFHDSYSSDIPSLAPALDFLRRQAPQNHPLTVILSDPDDLNDEEDAKDLQRILAESGVKRLITVGPKLSRMHLESQQSFDSTAKLLSVLSPSDFLHEQILIKGSPQFHFDEIVEMLEAKQHETVMEVNLDAVASNFNFFRSKLKPTTGIVCMLKASGYGAGSLELARTVQALGAAYVAVAVHDEGVELREGGVTMPIMVLNPKVENFKSLFTHHLEPEIYSFEFLERLIGEARKCGVKHYPIHIKLDTGMHRLGFLKEDMPNSSTC